MIAMHFKGFQSDWCISTIPHCRDISFWSEIHDLFKHIQRYIQSHMFTAACIHTSWVAYYHTGTELHPPISSSQLIQMVLYLQESNQPVFGSLKIMTEGEIPESNTCKNSFSFDFGDCMQGQKCGSLLIPNNQNQQTSFACHIQTATNTLAWDSYT